MHSIISLQNIALEIPIVTKSSVLDVGKVSQIRFCFIHTLNRKVQKLSVKIRLVQND